MNRVESDISLAEAIGRIQRNKRRVFVCLAVGLLAGILVGELSRRVYVGEVVVVPQIANSSGGASSIAKRLSGLASIAGISVGGQETTNRDIAIATLTSYQTIASFLQSEGIERQILDERDRFNPASLLGFTRPRTLWESVRAFREHMIVSQDKDTSLVHVVVDWYDPQSASAWANRLVAISDAELRSTALGTARGRLNYLQRELESNPVVSIREVVSGMIEENLRTLATAGADREYAFRIVDPAVPPERSERPKKLLIAVAFASAGLFIGILSAVLFDRHR